MFEREPILEGPRLDLRPFTEGDISEAYVGWLNDKECTKYSNQRFRTHTAETCLAYVRSFVGTDNRFLLVTERSKALPIGTMTVYPNRHHGTVDLGIMIGERSVWDQGYGGEAWGLVMKWLKSEPKVRKITAGTLEPNRSMVSIMERCEMEPDGRRTGQELFRGIPYSIVYYAKFCGQGARVKTTGHGLEPEVTD